MRIQKRALACFLAVLSSFPIGLTGCSDRGNKGDKQLTQQKNGQARGKVDFVLSADELIKDLVAQHDADEKKYRGKVVELTGHAWDINCSGGVAYIALGKPIPDIFVICKFPVERGISALKISKNQKVTIVGNFENFHRPLEVRVVNCELIDSPASAVESITSEAITSDKQTAEKYRNKPLLVTGELSQVLQSGVLKFVKLKGTADSTVWISHGDTNLAIYENRVGKRVTMRCEPFPDDWLTQTKIQRQLTGTNIIGDKELVFLGSLFVTD